MDIVYELLLIVIVGVLMGVIGVLLYFMSIDSIENYCFFVCYIVCVVDICVLWLGFYVVMLFYGECMYVGI